jgi:hypothetical protein
VARKVESQLKTNNKTATIFSTFYVFCQLFGIQSTFACFGDLKIATKRAPTLIIVISFWVETSDLNLCLCFTIQHHVTAESCNFVARIHQDKILAHKEWILNSLRTADTRFGRALNVALNIHFESQIFCVGGWFCLLNFFAILRTHECQPEAVLFTFTIRELHWNFYESKTQNNEEKKLFLTFRNIFRWFRCKSNRFKVINPKWSVRQKYLFYSLSIVLQLQFRELHGKLFSSLFSHFLCFYFLFSSFKLLFSLLSS